MKKGEKRRTRQKKREGEEEKQEHYTPFETQLRPNERRMARLFDVKEQKKEL